jgi:hypothetical protein
MTVNQLSEQDLGFHVTLAGWLLIANNAIGLILGLCGLVVLVGTGMVAAMNGDPTALGVLAIIGVVSVLFFAVLGLPGILAGIGMLRRQQWGRILGIIIGLLSLLSVPIGTAIGIYTLFVLFQDSANDYFAAPRAE